MTNGGSVISECVSCVIVQDKQLIKQKKNKKTESLKLGKTATKGLSEERGQNMDSVGLVKAQSNAHLFTSTFHADVDTALSVGAVGVLLAL